MSGRKKRPPDHKVYSFVASAETRELLERYSALTGLNFSQIIEQAIGQLYELKALKTTEHIFTIKEI